MSHCQEEVSQRKDKVILCRRGVAVPISRSFDEKVFTLKRYVTTATGRKLENVSLITRGKTHNYLPRSLGEYEVGRDSLLLDRIPVPVGRSGVTFIGELRSHQTEAAERFMRAVENGRHAGGVIVMPCGFGKTALAVFLGTCLIRHGSVIVIVHKTFLMNQWAESIRKFAPTASIGFVQGKRTEFDRDFIIASIQTLTGSRSRELGDLVARHCAFAIFDETHHLAAKTFLRTVESGIVPCRYRLGLTATPDRKDGLTDLFLAHLGPILFSVTRQQNEQRCSEQPGSETQPPNPGVVSQVSLSSGEVRVCKNAMGRFDYIATMTSLVACETRDEHIMRAIEHCLTEGRHIMVLSERRNHLLRLHAKSAERFPDAMCGLYMGGMKDSEMAQTLEVSRVMFVTVSMAAEGLDCPRLDTVIFATPPSASVEQCVGRAQRRVHAHGTLVVDFVDDVFRHRFRDRRRIYRQLGFTIRDGGETEPEPEPEPELEFI